MNPSMTNLRISLSGSRSSLAAYGASSETSWSRSTAWRRIAIVSALYLSVSILPHDRHSAEFPAPVADAHDDHVREAVVPIVALEGGADVRTEPHFDRPPVKFPVVNIIERLAFRWLNAEKRQDYVRAGNLHCALDPDRSEVAHLRNHGLRDAGSTP